MQKIKTTKNVVYTGSNVLHALKKAKVFSFRTHNKDMVIVEECDYTNDAILDKDQLYKLADEIKDIADDL